MSSTDYKATDSHNEFSIMDTWSILIEYKRIIFISTTFFTILGILFSLFSAPVYRAEVLMISADEQSSSSAGLSSMVNQYSAVAGLAGINLGGGGSNGTHEALAILQSRKFIEQFIKEEKLLTTIFHKNWNEEKKEWRTKPPTMEKAYKAMLNISSVSMNLDSRIITFSIEWKDPKKAANWANLMINKVNSDIRNRAIDEAEKSIRYLLDQRNNISLKNTQNVLSSLVEQQTKNIMIANVREQYAFKVIDPAVAPDNPDRPNKLLNTIVAFLFGLLFSVLIALFSKFKIQNSKYLVN